MENSKNYAEIWRQVKDLPWCVLATTGRTGTDFFQSLLDSHPEVFVFNGQLYFHDFWERSKATKADGRISGEDLVDEFIDTHIMHFKSHLDTFERKDQLGENRDQSIDIDTGELRTHILGLLADRQITSRAFLIAANVAYALCLGQDISRKKLFFHHQHRIRRLVPFLADFPDSKIICMTRDPRALYVSGVENWRRIEPKADHPHYPLYILWRSVDEIVQLKPYNDDRLQALKLEDLALENTLIAVCDWMGIGFDPCMNDSTWAGLRWWGDKLSTNKIPKNERGFSKTISTNNWEERLSALDKAVLNYLLADILSWYGYPHHRRNGIFIAVFIALTILIPTGYERRYISFRYLGGAIRERNTRNFIGAFYHPLRRMIQFYKWFYRRNFGAFFMAPYIGQDKS